MRALALLLVMALLAVVVATQSACSSAGPSAGSSAAATLSAGDDALARAFEARADGVEVEGVGTVERVLADDTNGSRHQRFILRLASGQTLLVAHNIDIAPRVPGLAVGDRVSFRGEYEWSVQGGTVHWTHHDPSGEHAAGWLRHGGQTYQ